MLGLWGRCFRLTLGQVLANARRDTLLQRLQAARTPEEAKAILKSVPGLKVNLDPEITIEFQ